MTRGLWDVDRVLGRSVRLDQESLGELVYQVVLGGGEIDQVWAFNRLVRGSRVFARVRMSEEVRAGIESVSAFRFKKVVVERERNA